MNPITIGKATLYNIDCMELLKATPDKFYDLAIVDPPYGIHKKLKAGANYQTKSNKFALMYEEKNWDKETPQKEYFDEVIRTSKNQIIWGGNYFTDKLPPSRGWICWDKEGDAMTTVNNELAWSSYDKAMKMFRRFHGLDKGFMNKEGANIHPTQKPVALYRWLLKSYAKPGDKIIDTHVGSASSLIACYELGFDYMGFELDKWYFDKATERLEQVKNQISIKDLFMSNEE